MSQSGSIADRTGFKCPLYLCQLQVVDYNTSIKSFGWELQIPRILAWSFVELPSHFVELGLRVHGQV